MLTNPSAPLQDLLTVHQDKADRGICAFSGSPHPTLTGRSFGGQIMAQAAISAGLTVDDARKLHSLHGYFVLPGDANQTTNFVVDHLFDGGSFSTRRVQALQEEHAIMSMIASFQKPSSQTDLQHTFDMCSVPQPAQLTSLAADYAHFAGSKAADFVINRPFEFRYIDADVMQTAAPKQTTQRVWVRAKEPLAGSALIQRAALTFCSDYLFVEPALRALGYSWSTPGLKAASLDHALWFHEDFAVEDWLLYELTAVHAGSGRAFSQGRFFNMQGLQVASCAQEVMLRIPDSNSNLHN